MSSFVLNVTALVAVAFSFAFGALVVVHGQRSGGARAAEPRNDNEPQRSSDATMSRVVADVERLAALRDRGVLTDKEFAAGKAKILDTRRAPTPAKPSGTTRQ